MANAGISDFLALDKSRDGPARPDTVSGSVRDPLLSQALQKSADLAESGAVEF